MPRPPVIKARRESAQPAVEVRRGVTAITRGLSYITEECVSVGRNRGLAARRWEGPSSSFRSKGVYFHRREGTDDLFSRPG